MKVFINDFSLNCALGNNQEEVCCALFSDKLNESIEFNLVDGQTTPILTVHANLPNISNELNQFNSKNNQFILMALNNMKDSIQEVVDEYGKNRIGVIVGTSTSGIFEGIDAIKNIQEDKLPSNYDYSLQEIGSPSLFIKEYLDLDSIAYTISTACSSGARSFIEGKQLIENDICDAVIVGGSDSLNELTLNGFHSLEAISTNRTNPFSKNRQGINIGEGASLFLLTKNSGKFEVLGVGESTDGHHISSPDPSAAGAIEAMKMALADANLEPNKIDYINLHGTGTIKNDEMESLAVSTLFPNNPPVSSTKPFVGHTLGAAGAIELAFCLLSIKNKKLPIHHWDSEVDDSINTLNLVGPTSKIEPQICMSNSYAFGGNNTSIIVGEV